MKNTSREAISRRNLLKTVGVGAISLTGSAVVSGVSAKEAQPSGEPSSEDKLQLGLPTYMFKNYDLDQTIAMAQRVAVPNICIRSNLLPLDASSGQYRIFNGLLLYQDRNFGHDGDDLTINGNDSLGMDVRGTIYLPDGDVKVNGNLGGLVMDQVISKTFDALGNGGDILALKEANYIFKFTAAGLVE